MADSSDRSVRPAGAASRRRFLRAGAGLAAAGALGALLSRAAAAASPPASPDYGPLRDAADETTGLPLLKLPEGFRYLSFGWTGDPLGDGTPTPPDHDGMAVIAQDGDRVTLVRNHEVRAARPAFCETVPVYDAGAGGGCTRLAFDARQGRWLEAWPALAGTSANCAGGPAPWGAWLSCEETLAEPAAGGTFRRSHGWVFEVPAEGRATGAPLPAMGRFVHEALAVDARSGHVYQTEDNRPCGLYRFVPARPGHPAQGGALEMLKVAGARNADLSNRGAGPRVPVGAVLDVEWVPIDDPERAHAPGTRDGRGVAGQGFARGAAAFSRLEGAWARDGTVYFVSTDGGAARLGQVWALDTRAGALALVFEARRGGWLGHPDGVTLSPRGTILLCEDGAAPGRGERLVGLTADGRLFPFAENAVVLGGQRGLAGDFRTGEWSGATFSPDGRWLFANLQRPGVTLAITGPWPDGAL